MYDLRLHSNGSHTRPATRGTENPGLYSPRPSGRGSPYSADPVPMSEETFDRTHGEGHAVSMENPLLVIWRRWWIIALTTAALVGLAVGFSVLQTPSYGATIKVLVGTQQGDGAVSNLQTDVAGLQGIAETAAIAVDTRPVAQEVVDRSGLNVAPETVLENMTVEPIGTSQFIEVSYTDTDPQRAQEVANAVGSVFSEQISEVSPGDSAVTAEIWERAVAPESPSSPNLMLNALFALVLGLMLGAALAFVVDYLDDNWRSPEEVERVSGVPTFGVIPAFKTQKTKKKEG